MLDRLKSISHSAKKHQGFRRYFANTSWMFAEQVLRLIAGLLVGIWVARYLGPSQFGVFSYSLAFAAIFGSIAKLGLDSIVIRDLLHTPEQRDRYLGTAFWLKLVGAMLSLVIIVFATQHTSNDATTNLYIYIIAAGTIFQSFEVVDFYFQSQVLSKFVSICRLSQLLISTILRLYLIITGAELVWFVLVVLIDQITLAIALYLAYRYQKLDGFYLRFDQAIAKRFLRDGWPLMVSGITILIYIRVDQIMIKEMLGEREVGIYSAAVKLSELWYFIPMIIVNSLFPAIVNAKKKCEELYYIRLQRLYSLLTWVAIGVAIPMTFLSNWLVMSLYGEAFKEAGPVLMVQVWTGVFVSLGVASGCWFTSENLQRYAFYRTLLGALINILLNLVLIKRFGLIGAAMATLIAQSMAAWFFDLFSKQTRRTFMMKLNAFNFMNLFNRT